MYIHVGQGMKPSAHLTKAGQPGDIVVEGVDALS